MIVPWLPTTASTARLETDLKARGWRVWWTGHGGVRLFAPDGATITIDGATPAQTLRNAYASAMEYANAQTGQAILDAYELGLGLGLEGVKA